jgi:hypothetical protein
VTNPRLSQQHTACKHASTSCVLSKDAGTSPSLHGAYQPVSAAYAWIITLVCMLSCSAWTARWETGAPTPTTCSSKCLTGHPLSCLASVEQPGGCCMLDMHAQVASNKGCLIGITPAWVIVCCIACCRQSTNRSSGYVVCATERTELRRCYRQQAPAAGRHVMMLKNIVPYGMQVLASPSALQDRAVPVWLQVQPHHLLLRALHG